LNLEVLVKGDQGRALALAAALVCMPALAYGQPVITSITPAPSQANTGAFVHVAGVNFGGPFDVVTFPGGGTASPGLFGSYGSGYVDVRVPATWSGNVTVTPFGGSTSAGFSHDVTFSYSGQYWPGGSLPFTWFLNQNGAPGCTVDQTRDALITGYNAWSCASGVSMTYGGTTALATTSQDGTNCRYWSNSGWSPGTIAVTTWWYNTTTNQIVEADIAFNSQHYTWSCTGAGGSMDVGNIGTHEEGHSIGLLDMYGADDAAKTMYGYGSNGETQKQTLHVNDVEGAEFIYPHGGRANFTAGTPGGWSGPLVPRNTADATGSFAPLPGVLNGNTTTYVNAAMANNGADCAAPYGTNNLWIDDDFAWWNSWGGVWGSGVTLGLWPNMGNFIRGGRHTLKYTMDDNGETAESNEFDNVYQAQFVWSPYLLADQTPIYRYAPPAVGPFVAANSDGYQFTGNWWSCVGIMPTTPGDDYDLQLFNDYANSTTGFASPLRTSAAGGTNVDFVLVNGNTVGYGATRWAGVDRFSVSGGGGYVDVQQSNQVGATLVPSTTYNAYVSSGSQTMGAYDLVKVHEVYLGSTSTTYTFSLVNSSGSADLNISLFAATGDYYSRYDYVATSETFGGGTNESFNYQPPAAGYYGVVVWKRNSNDLGLANDYELRVGAALSNLNATVTPGGFSSPAVPRNLNDAGLYNAVLTATLDGNNNDTYFNWATQQEGPNPMPGWDSYLIIDEGDYPYSWFFTTGPDNPAYFSWQAVNVGPNLVRGGRHSLTAMPNLFSGVPESNYADNVWRGQWVWSPLVTAKNVPNVRSAPPYGNLAYYPWPNSDGSQFTRNSLYAWVVSEAAQVAGDDNDLYVSGNYAGSTSGFDDNWGYSFWPGNLTDFVVGHYIGTPVALYPAAFRNSFGPNGNYASDQSDALGRSPGATGNFVDVVLPSNRLTDVYEANFAPNTTHYISLRRKSGTSDIAFEVFPGDAGGSYTRGMGAASTVLDPDFDVLTYTSGPSGTYWPLVVYRDTGLGSDTPVTYDLHWSTVGFVGTEGDNTPRELAFAGAAPNPMREKGTLSFDLPTEQHVRLQLFDVNGRLVRSLTDETLGAGRHAVAWDGRDENGSPVGAGLYWARFQATGKVISRRITVLR
jgi:hypothetical protein